MQGAVLGEFNAAAIEPTTKYSIAIKDGSEEKGPQEFTEYETNKGEIVTAGLEISQEGGNSKNPCQLRNDCAHARKSNVARKLTQ